MQGTLVYDKKPKAVWIDGEVLRVGATNGDSKAKIIEVAEAVELTRVPSVSPPFGFQFKIGKHEYAFYAKDTSECTSWLKALVAVGASPSRILSEMTFDASGQSLSKFPKAYLEKQGLSTLNLSSNSLTKLPEDFGSFAKLETLDLSSNQLKALPDAFGFLGSLKTLNLAENALTDLPMTFGRLTSLSSLTVSSNKLASVPPVIFTLTQLDTLNISYNPLSQTALPDAIQNLSLLRNLDISGCGLTALPDVLATSLTYLRVLEIFRNKLKTLPPRLVDLKLLTRLGIGRNQISALPELPQNLTELDITHNPIEDLPNSIGSHAVFIEFAECPLTKIPAEHRSHLSALKAYLASRGTSQQ